MKVSDTISEALLDQSTILLNFGEEVAPRGHKTLELINHSFKIMNPTYRHLLVDRRYANPFAQIAETLWVLAGRNDIDWLERYIPQCRKWSDDGKTWRAGYGPRLRNWYGMGDIRNGVDQIEYVISKLKEDPYSRQAVISLWDPRVDVYSGSKDYPCNNWLQFLVRDGKLHLSVILRSNDIIYGFSHCDFYIWSVLQELVANCLRVEIGTLTWFAGSFHVYERHWDLLKEMSIVNVPHNIEPLKIDVTSLNDFDRIVNGLFDSEEDVRNGNIDTASVEAAYYYYIRRSDWASIMYIMFVAYEMKLQGFSNVEIDSLLVQHLGNSDLYYSTALYLFREDYEKHILVET